MPGRGTLGDHGLHPGGRGLRSRCGQAGPPEAEGRAALQASPGVRCPWPCSGSLAGRRVTPVPASHVHTAFPVSVSASACPRLSLVLETPSSHWALRHPVCPTFTWSRLQCDRMRSPSLLALGPAPWPCRRQRHHFGRLLEPWEGAGGPPGGCRTDTSAVQGCGTSCGQQEPGTGPSWGGGRGALSAPRAGGARAQVRTPDSQKPGGPEIMTQAGEEPEPKGHTSGPWR